MRQIILGSLLGDGYIDRWNWFREKHSPKQKDYLLWKNQFLNGRISEFTVKNSFSLQKVNLLKKLPTEFRRLFYPDGKKIISEEILNQLNELGLAVWYCDDGSYSYQYQFCDISTQGYSFEEQVLIQKWFKEKWDIECKIQKIKRTNRHQIRFNRKETEQFLNLVKPFILQMPKCMRYKLGHLYEDNLPLFQETQQKVKERAKLLSKRFYEKHKEEIKKKYPYNKKYHHEYYLNHKDKWEK